MQKLIIKNLGPIKEATIDLKTFVVFIGPSGSGKSILMRTISMLQWVYKKMQYKMFLKKAKMKNDAFRINFARLKKDSMLDDFIKQDTSIEFFDNDVSMIVIKNLKINLKYKNIKNKSFINSKIVFLNDSRVALAEILSSAGGRKAKFSYYTSDMIDNFYKATEYIDDFEFETMDIKLSSKKKDNYKQFFLQRENKTIKFDNASSGEKNITILELIASFYAKEYDFNESFSKTMVGIITSNIDIKSIEVIKNYMKKSEFLNLLNIFIEEPESNLFPIDQKNIAYYLSSLRSHTNKPNIILSTHSPYILTALNNLIYAKNIINENPNLKDEICNIIKENELLDIKDLSVYMLENNEATYIINKNTNLISADKIDEASECIMGDFDKILSIQRKAHE